MPIVNLVWDPAWLADGEDGATAQRTLLEYLARYVLPGAVADAISLADGHIVSAGNVLISGNPSSTISFNLPSLWIDIQCDGRGETVEDRSARRRLIVELVQWRVSAFYRRFRELIEPPDYDIECRETPSSGMTVSPEGEIGYCWG